MPDDRVTSALRILADESSAVAALIDVNDDYRVVWVNERLKTLLTPMNISPEGMRWGGRCPFAFGMDGVKVLDKVVKTGEPVFGVERPFGTRVSSRFGETTYWNWKCLPAASVGCPGCVLVIAENVTDHVARRTAERNWQAVFTGAVLDLPIGVATIDPDDFRVLDANDAWLAYMAPEFQTRESIGKTLFQCMSNFESSGFADVLRKVSQTSETFNDPEFELRAVHGSIWWTLSIKMIEIGQGGRALLVMAWEVTEQANARQRLEASRHRADALLRIQQAIIASLSLDEVLGMINTYACELMDSPASAVFLLSGDGKSFSPRGAQGISLTEDNAKPLSSPQSLAFKALREHRPVAISSEQSIVARALPRLDSGQPIAEIAAAPIETDSERIGVIEVYNDRHRRYTNDELETLKTFASAAAVAIVNARLYEQAQRAQQELEERTRVAENERQLALTILDSIPDAIAVASPDLRIVQMNEAARAVFKAIEGTSPLMSDVVAMGNMRTTDGRLITPDEHPLIRALKGEEVHNFDITLADTNEGLQYRSVSGAPVRDKKGNIIYGVIIGRDVTQNRIAQAKLEEAYEREKRIAEALQQAVLSAVPQSFGRIELAAKYEAGVREAEIGGDFFDVFTPEDGKLAVVIGDVEGKGLAAAVQIAAAKYGIRSYAYENPSPANVMTRLNYAMYRDQTIAGFVTIFYALIDCENLALTYVNGGHEPPLIRHDNGKVESLLSGGLIVGIEPEFVYDERTIDLHPGDKLLLYTDGVTEARKENGEMLGEERLISFWTGLTEDQAQTLLDAVYDWAKDFSEGHFHDDVALLVVNVKA